MADSVRCSSRKLVQVSCKKLQDARTHITLAHALQEIARCLLVTRTSSQSSLQTLEKPSLRRAPGWYSSTSYKPLRSRGVGGATPQAVIASLKITNCTQKDRLSSPVSRLCASNDSDEDPPRAGGCWGALGRKQRRMSYR